VKKNLAVIALALTSISSASAAVTGSFSLAGLGPAFVNGNDIDFYRSLLVADPDGRFLLTEAEGDFLAIPPDAGGDTRGTIKDLTMPPVIPGVPTLVPMFIMFDTSSIYLDLTLLNEGVGSTAGCSSTALGANCTPTVGPGVSSPFTLTNEAEGVTVSLSVQALAYSGTGDSNPTPYRGLFATQITSLPNLGTTVPRIPDVLAAAATTGVVSSVSAEFAPIPEPSTILLGLAVLVCWPSDASVGASNCKTRFVCLKKRVPSGTRFFFMCRVSST